MFNKDLLNKVLFAIPKQAGCLGCTKGTLIPRVVQMPSAAKKNTGNRLYIDPSIVSCWEGGFPGGPVVKNLPCNAGDTGLIPGWGTKIPHVEEQLIPRVTTTELASQLESL